MDVKPRAADARHRLALLWERVRIPHLVAGLALLSSLATSLLIGITWQSRLDALDDGRIDRYGQALAAQIAALAVEPLIAGDRIRLGVLAQRMSEFPEIATVAVNTIDERTVAHAGAAQAQAMRHYAHPIAFEETLAGHVRVAVDPARLRAPGAEQFWLPALIMVLISGGLGYAVGQHLEARTMPRPRPLSDPVDGDGASADGARFLLVVNLFNLGSVPADLRGSMQGALQQRVAQVADLHAADCTELAGTGLLVTFPPAVEDACFHALCAALLCADMLEAFNDSMRDERIPRLALRYGLHVATGALGGEDRDDEAVADAVLLSAVARNGTIALSHAAFDQLEDADRVEWQTHQNPILETMTTSSGDTCVLVTDLVDEHRLVLEQAADRLAQPTSTASASTF